MRKRAFITGVTGQDGSYLAEFLAEKGYEVHGYSRRGSRMPAGVDHLHFGDLLDPASLSRALHEAEPHEIYNLGAQSHVGASFESPTYTYQCNVLPLCSIFKYAAWAKTPRVYQASTSEMFGNVPAPQSEGSPFNPRSPYAVAKVAAHMHVRLEREAYGRFACCGILFNHESPRRPPSFVTRKVTMAAARIKSGLQESLELGAFDSARDWGYAPEYVEAMWLMLQRSEPRDYVIATGETHTVRELVECAFQHVGLDWEKYVRLNEAHRRPADVHRLRGDATKAAEDLGWRPRTKFRELVSLMVDSDLAADQYENRSNTEASVARTSEASAAL